MTMVVIAVATFSAFLVVDDDGIIFDIWSAVRLRPLLLPPLAFFVIVTSFPLPPCNFKCVSSCLDATTPILPSVPDFRSFSFRWRLLRRGITMVVIAVATFSAFLVVDDDGIIFDIWSAVRLRPLLLPPLAFFVIVTVTSFPLPSCNFKCVSSCLDATTPMLPSVLDYRSFSFRRRLLRSGITMVVIAVATFSAFLVVDDDDGIIFDIWSAVRLRPLLLPPLAFFVIVTSFPLPSCTFKCVSHAWMQRRQYCRQCQILEASPFFGAYYAVQPWPSWDRRCSPCWVYS